MPVLGRGGSGTVVVRYKIGSMLGADKSNRWFISFYGGKTIHTFVSAGNLVFPATISDVEMYICSSWWWWRRKI